LQAGGFAEILGQELQFSVFSRERGVQPSWGVMPMNGNINIGSKIDNEE